MTCPMKPFENSKLSSTSVDSITFCDSDVGSIWAPFDQEDIDLGSSPIVVFGPLLRLPNEILCLIFGYVASYNDNLNSICRKIRPFSGFLVDLATAYHVSRWSRFDRRMNQNFEIYFIPGVNNQEKFALTLTYHFLYSVQHSSVSKVLKGFSYVRDFCRCGRCGRIDPWSAYLSDRRYSLDIFQLLGRKVSVFNQLTKSDVEALVSSRSFIQTFLFPYRDESAVTPKKAWSENFHPRRFCVLRPLSGQELANGASVQRLLELGYFSDCPLL